MFHTHLIPVGLAVITGGCALAGTFNDWSKRAVNVLAALTGFLVAGAILIDPAAAGLRHWIGNMSIGPVNITLTLGAWCTTLAYFEAWKADSRTGHWLRTPVVTALAAFFVPLFSLARLSLVSLGIMFLGIAVIVLYQTRGAGKSRHVGTICAALGAALVAGLVGSYVGGLKDVAVGGIGLGAILAVIFGFLTYLHHRADSKRYHHIRTTIYAAVAACGLVFAGGATATHLFIRSENGVVGTVAKVSHSHGTDNPFAGLDKDAVNGISHAARYLHGHHHL